MNSFQKKNVKFYINFTRATKLLHEHCSHARSYLFASLPWTHLACARTLQSPYCSPYILNMSWFPKMLPFEAQCLYAPVYCFILPLLPLNTHCDDPRTVQYIQGVPKKLDKVGPLDNRPSTEKLHHFVKKNYMTCDMWHMTCVMWHTTYDMCQVKDRGWLTLCKNCRSLALMVLVRRCLEDSRLKDEDISTNHQSVNQLINE